MKRKNRLPNLNLLLLLQYSLLLPYTIAKCLEISIKTTSECVDVPDFTDAFLNAFLNTCPIFEGYDCWADLLGVGFPEHQAVDIFHGCPKSCGLCLREKTRIEVIDGLTGLVPVLSEGSDFDGIVLGILGEPE